MHFKERKERSHREIVQEEFRDKDKRTEKFEEEAKSVMVSMRVGD